MRVTFVNPNYGNPAGPVIETALPPLDLVNCATILQKKGFHVEIVDAAILKMDAKEVASKVTGNDVVAVTTFSLSKWQTPPLEMPHFYDVLTELKNCGPRPFIITLGPNSLFNPEGLAKVSDLVVLGQAEPFFEQLTPTMRTEDYFGLDGIAFMKGGRFIRKGKPQWYDLKRLPQPNLKLLPHLNYRYAILNGPMMVVETSRGCPEDCSFCFRGMTNYTFSSKNSEQVINELRYIQNKLGIDHVWFADLSIDAAKNVFKAWMREFIRQNLKIRWGCNIRISALEDEQIVKLMGEAGCEVVSVGIEGVTQNAFDDLKKNKNEKTVIQKIKLLKEHGIKTLGYFLLGSAYEETEDDIDKAIKFAKSVGLNYAVFYIAIPYPSTRFYDQIKPRPLNLSSEKIPKCYTKHFTHNQLIRLRKRAYLRFYLRPRNIVSHLGQLRHPKDYFRTVKLFWNIIRE